jgi:hypothetical protein
MKNIIILYIIFICFGCKSHKTFESKQESISLDYNYVFANIFINDIERKEMDDYIITLYKYSSKDKIPSEGTHENYVNYAVSVANEGEFIKSQLFEIKNQIFPLIKNIDIKNRILSITIEQGNSLKRQSKKIDFKLDF